MTKCDDVIASMDEILTKVELVIANTLEGMDLIGQSIEGSLKDLREHIQDLKEGCQHDNSKNKECNMKKRQCSTTKNHKLQTFLKQSMSTDNNFLILHSN